MALFSKTLLVSPFIFFSVLGGIVLSSSVSFGMEDDFREKGPRDCSSQLGEGLKKKKRVQEPVGYGDAFQRRIAPQASSLRQRWSAAETILRSRGANQEEREQANSFMLDVFTDKNELPEIRFRALENITDDQKKQSASDALARDVESDQEEKEFSFMLRYAEDRNKELNSRLMILESILCYGSNEKKDLAYNILFSIAQDGSVPFYQRMKIISYVLFYTDKQRLDAYSVVISIVQDEKIDVFFRIMAAKTIVESNKDGATAGQAEEVCEFLILFAKQDKNTFRERLKVTNSIIRAGTEAQILKAKAIRDALERDFSRKISAVGEDWHDAEGCKNLLLFAQNTRNDSFKRWKALNTIRGGTKAQILKAKAIRDTLEKDFYDNFFKSHPKFIGSVLAGEYLPITE